MFDAIVIGGGPGGYVSAIRLSQLGKKVAIIEKKAFGGTCTNVGCIPTKAMLTSSHLYSEITEKSKKFGIEVENVNYNLKSIMNHMKKIVTSSKKGVEFLMKKNKIAVYNGTAEILDKNTIKIKETNDKLETKNLILAHGSVPVIFPPFNEIEGLWTSDDVFSIEKLPDSILIIGGGVIGIEFSTFFSTLGKKVYIIELANHILPTEDLDVANEVKKVIKKNGVSIYEKHKVLGVEKRENSYITEILNSETNEKISIETEKVLMAVGRKPNITEDIKKLGVTIERGVVSNNKMETNIKNVYAVGDIKGKVMLAHVAMFEGIVAAHNIAGEEKKMDYSAVPSIIFSNPEVASTGLREKDVDKEKVLISKFPLSANPRARTLEEKYGFVKIIADKETKKILGMSIVSPNATDMIMEGVISVRNNMKIENLVDSIHPHPTLTESFLGALEGLEGMSIHL